MSFLYEGPLRKVYFDHNATTPIHPEVAEVVKDFWGEYFGNPSSLHWAGREVREFYEGSREKVAHIIGAQTDEIIFTSGGTEGANHAIKGVASKYRGRGNHIITSMIEHPCVLNTCRYLEANGYEVTYLPVDGYGNIDPGLVRKAITKNTILISIMYANNETGTLMPIEEIGKIARENDVLFHSDMVQAIGKVPIDICALNVDLANFSGHKVYAPKGIGALYIKNGLEIDTLLHGGHQEGGKRAGTENVIGAVALGKACEIAEEELAEENRKTEFLREKLLNGIIARLDNIWLNGHPKNRLPNTLNISFEYIESESLLIALDHYGIAVSAGSACSSGSGSPSHVLIAMGVPPVACQSATRMSLGRANTEEDIDYALTVIPDVVNRLREMSPFYTKE